MRIGNVKLNAGAFILLACVVLGLGYLAFSRLGLTDRLSVLLRGSESESVSLGKREKVENIDVSQIPKSQVKPPTTTTDNPSVVIGLWTWQTESGIIDAVGGVSESGMNPDSSLAKAGATRTKLLVQNDTSEQAKLLASGQLHIMTTTGDQAAVDIAGANKLLGGNYAKAVFSAGYSYGEDCLMGPESLMTDPQLARGLVVVTAAPYCDWNVTVNWAIDNKDGDGNGIPINPNESTYDPNAINFVNAVDHIEAAKKFVENTKVALRNVKTGKLEEREIDAVATWTPGDVMAVRGRPTVTYKGKTEKLQKIISTRKYDFMMPNILVVDIRWANQHRDYLNTLFRIVARSNEKIQEDPSYFRTRIAPLNTLVFNMESAAFWDKYFKGTVENGVPLGGSRVNNISEIRHLFGMDQNVSIENSVFGITYRSHGERLKAILPDRLPEVIPVSEVVDTSFIRDITDERTTSTNYQANFAESSSDRVAVNANYQINFDNNSATIRPSEYSKLQDLMGLLIRAGNTKIAIEGHTDASGDVNHNVALSQRRAQAVWQWLIANDRSGVINQQRLIGQPQGFGPYRILEGKSPTDPLNRRVSVTLR